MIPPSRTTEPLHRNPSRLRDVLRHDNPAVRVIRLVFGLLGFSTVIINIFIVANLPEGLHLPNYLSAFTNEVNLLAGAVLAVSGLVPRERLPRWWDGLRGAVTLYLAVTFVVWIVLLEGLPTAGVITPWVNFVVHRLMPIVLVVDWLLIPAAYAARWWRPIGWMAFPVAFLAYSLVRGAFVGWYPYPFIDPRGPAGYAGLIGSTGGILIGFLAAALLIDQLGRLRRRLSLPAHQAEAA